MLKDWDFARFFPLKYQNQDSSSSASSSSAIKIREARENEKKLLTHRRIDSDSKINNPFFRGFRRENSDFFPISSRHSAILFDRNVRASNIFNKRRGSDVGIEKKSGEPILTDFVSRNMDSPNKEANKNHETNNTFNNKKENLLKKMEALREDGGFVKPRREKTESYIVLRQSEARREILEARRREVELQFAKEAENMRRRSARPIEVNSIALSSATNSVSGEEYPFLQVIFSSFCFTGWFFHGCA